MIGDIRTHLSIKLGTNTVVIIVTIMKVTIKNNPEKSIKLNKFVKPVINIVPIFV